MDKANFVDPATTSKVALTDFDNSLYVYLENTCPETVKSLE